MAIELADLVARWIHVIAGIMWVGNSMLFNWLDRSLEAPDRKGITPSPGGTIWLLHSGGFYYVEKTLLAGAPYPRLVHWFKWQAYTTWLSGLALLLVVYWAGGRAVLADPSVASLTAQQALAVAVGSIAGGWLLYELAQRWIAPRAPALSLVVWVAGLVAIAIAMTRLLDGRAAFLHVGAMLGSIMAGNVFFTIVPSQRALVAAVRGDAGSHGPATAAVLSARAKRVSIHNNYFTFPVLVLMVSGHFPALYSHPLRAMLLLVLIAGGAGVRHVLNVRFTTPSWRPALAGVIAVTIALLALLLSRPATRDRAGVSGSGTETVAAAADSAPVSFAEVRHVIDRRCAACHSAQPSDLSFGVAPGGVMFDTPEQIVVRALRIRERAVTTRSMPPGNQTNITDAERALLDRWVAAGAASSQLPR